MENKNLIISLILVASLLVSLGFVSAQSLAGNYQSNSFTQYSTPTFQQFYSSQGIDYKQFWPSLDGSCDARGDFIVNVRPGGCSPAVVRSDLLEEQNVPVFCKLDAVKLNPIIDIASLKSVGFQVRGLDNYVAGISYHPSQIALRIYQPVLNNPLMNDIGYAVVVLKRQVNESSMPDFVEANLTAVLTYDMREIFGAGQTNFFLPIISESEWGSEYNKYAFWKGRGYLRVNWIDQDRAEISVYNDVESVIRKLVLTKGQTSDRIEIPGFYCKAGVRIQLTELSSGKARIRLQVDNNEFWLVEGEKFLDNCYVKSIKKIGAGGQATLRCYGKDYVLRVGISDKISINVRNDNKEVGLGEVVDPSASVYLAYIGQAREDLTPGITSNENSFIVLVKNPTKTEKVDEVVRIKQETLVQIADNFNTWMGEADSTKKKNEKWYQAENIRNNLASALGVGKDSVEIIFNMSKGKQDVIINSKTVKPFEDYQFIDSIGVKDVNYNLKSTAPSTADSVQPALLEDYFAESSRRAYEIVSLYGSEKDSLGDYYGARILAELAELAERLGKQKTQLGILRNLTDKYPGSNYARDAASKIEDLAFFNYESAASLVTSGTESHYLKLEQVIEPGLDEASAKFTKKVKNSQDSNPIVLKLNEKVYIDTNDINSESLQLLKLEEDRIKIEYRHRLTDDATTPTAQQVYIKKGEAVTLKKYTNKIVVDEFSLTLDDIKLEKLAQVSLISEMPDGISQANFTVRIGVEKRAIELNPDKTGDRIENLNESIKDLSKIVEDLGDVVKVWKGACFATSGVLLVKNLFTNMGGKSLARQEVMKNYWKTQCAREASEGLSKSIEECYAKHNSDIEKSVNDYASEISNANSLATSLKGENTEVTRDNYARAFKDYVKANPGQVVNSQGTTLIQVFGNVGNSDATIDRMVKNGDLRVEEMRDIMLASRLSSTQKEIGDRLLEKNINPVYEVAKRAALVSGYSLKSLGGDIPIQALGDAKKIGKIEYVRISSLTQEQADKIQSSSPMERTAKTGDKFIVIPTYPNAGKHANKVIYVPLEKRGSTYTLTDKEGYELDKDGNVVNVIPKDEMNQIVSKMGVGSFSEINAGMCNNKYLNAKVKFYETEPYKGMPAVVPLDTSKGWYAATKQIIPGFGMTPYSSSGAVSSLWMCNVGTNGREEFDVLNDDLCIQLNYDTGQPQGQLMCLSEGEARRLASLAKSAVESAASQYKTMTPGSGKVNLPGIGSFSVEKAVSTVGTECTDFMSPSDCNLMFNVCDPVLCPSSRCNLGGSFHVDDVVQSGIIGSIALCLPNFGSPSTGGVIVPVCLTGIYAGLDAYVSVLKAHKQCLEENLETGAFTGICDEIYSIYLCEFFWRQGAPLLDMALPKIVEMLYTGGKTRGGGEYMTVTHAWDTAQGSLSYFTNYYAVNAMKAFKARSTNEVGTEICKAFISSNYPSSKGMLDQLLEPENPVQFYAKFDEIAYSDATLPSTSQYKVYYHIFAGRDQGHYFQVYLKDPPGTASYAAQPVIYVDSGYVGIGQYATQTKDFTAPAGYKELCVRIDTQEECGFKQVTTEFAIDYLKDLYMNEQGSEFITSEKTCVSGTPSLYSLANPNLQEAGQEMLQPAIYKRGLIRVCATNNPGNSTDLGRWKDVGYCGDTRIRCWLDGVSVENVIQDKDLEKQTLTKAEEMMNQETLDKQELYTEDISNGKLKDAWVLFKKIIWTDIFAEDFNAFITRNPVYRANIKDVVILRNTAEELSSKAFFNNQRVDAMFLGFEVYYKLSSQLATILKVEIDRGIANVNTASPSASSGVIPAAVISTGFELKNNEIWYKNNPTGWKLRDPSKNTVIFGEGDARIGYLLDGAINFDEPPNGIKTPDMLALEKYTFDGSKFVLGASGGYMDLYVDEKKVNAGNIYFLYPSQKMSIKTNCKTTRIILRKDELVLYNKDWSVGEINFDTILEQNNKGAGEYKLDLSCQEDSTSKTFIFQYGADTGVLA